MSDIEKTDACVAAAAAIVLTGESHASTISALLRKRLGPGWTVVSALQWLTGKRAWHCIETTPDGAQVGEYPKTIAIEMVRVAAAACKELDASAGTEAAIERVRRAAGKAA